MGWGRRLGTTRAGGANSGLPVTQARFAAEPARRKGVVGERHAAGTAAQRAVAAGGPAARWLRGPFGRKALRSSRLDWLSRRMTIWE